MTSTIQSKSLACETIDACHVRVGGLIGHRLELTWRKNLLALDWEKDFLSPFREKLGEGGGYVGMGKTLDGLVQFAAQTSEPKLLTLRRQVLDALIGAQETDGYLGTYRPESRVTRVWDVHEQSYVLFALVSDWRLFQERRSLEAATKLGNYLVDRLSGIPLPTEYNAATQSALAEELTMLGLDRALLALHRATKDRRYLDFCVQKLRLADWDLPIVEGRHGRIEGHAYAYLTRCLAQLDLYAVTGDARLLAQSRRALTYLRGGGMLVTGSCSLSECWHSDQTGTGDLEETCATAYLIRWLHRLLCLEGASRYGDWMERAIYNALFAAQSPDGRQLRYYTPFEGPRQYWDKDTYCCPGNFRRIMAELPGMIYYRQSDGLLVNLYTPSRATVNLAADLSLDVRQETDYPNSGEIVVRLNPSRTTKFVVRLRMPGWCRQFTAKVNDTAITPVLRQGFLVIKREWRDGDTISLSLEMPERRIRGYGKQAGRVAILQGPQLQCRRADGTVTEFTDPEGVATYLPTPDTTAALGDELMESN